MGDRQRSRDERPSPKPSRASGTSPVATTRRHSKPRPLAPSTTGRSRLARGEEALAVGEYAKAIALADELVAPQAGATRRLSPTDLGRLGSSSKAPRRSTKDLRSVRLDPRAAFVLAHLDGKTTIEQLIDLVPMNEAEVLAILVDLIAQGLVVV